MKRLVEKFLVPQRSKKYHKLSIFLFRRVHWYFLRLISSKSLVRQARTRVLRNTTSGSTWVFTTDATDVRRPMRRMRHTLATEFVS